MVDKKIIHSSIINSHIKIWEQLKNISISERVGSAYLFFGPSGVGKELIAIKFAQLLNCEQSQKEICGACSSCIRFSSLQHENLNLIFPLPTLKEKSGTDGIDIDKNNIDIVSQTIQLKSKDPFLKIKIPKANRILLQSIRRLRKTLYLRSQSSGRRMVLVFDSHLLNVGQGESANAFLKILEEPPSNTTIILVTDYTKLLPPTILSRCQKIGFSRLSNIFIKQWCEDRSVNQSHIPILIGLSRGNVHRVNTLIAQPLEELIKSVSISVKTITNENPIHWKKFVNTYSKISKQNENEFYLHFYILRIWFQSACRLSRNIDHILHSTSFLDGMKTFNRSYPKADFNAIINEIEKPSLAISKNYFMPLVLLNLLLETQRYLKS